MLDGGEVKTVRSLRIYTESSTKVEPATEEKSEDEDVGGICREPVCEQGGKKTGTGERAGSASSESRDGQGK